MRQLEASNLSLDGPGERTFFVTEELALEEA